MNKELNRSLVQWYLDEMENYEALAKVVAATIGALLKKNRIEGASVSFRTKSLESFKEKIRRKSYLNPKAQMTDLAGIRVVALVEKDIKRVEEAVKSSFLVHPENSLDKSAELGVDRFGYRSLHLVCDLGPKRTILEELEPFKGLMFEIQIRTALQHAWAEIEHDRYYKFNGDLPIDIKRRFNLLAANLESADREFSSLTEELERYSAEASSKLKKHDLNVEFNGTTIESLVSILLVDHGSGVTVETGSIDKNFIDELKDYGVFSIEDVRNLLSEDFLDNAFNQTSAGLLRDAMMYEDIEKYFKTAWKGRWSGWDDASIIMMIRRYGSDEIDRIFEIYNPVRESDLNMNVDL